MFTAILRDGRFALRMLVKTPGVTFVALLALALGVGANTAIFTLVKALLLSPLPYPEPERLVLMMRQYRDHPVPTISVLKLDSWTRNATSFEAVTGFDAIGSGYNVAGPGGLTERISGLRVAGDFFGVIGVRPVLGRGFVREELKAGGPKAVVLSHGLWLRMFGGDPSLIGRYIRMNSGSWQVVGVMPPSFRPTPAAEAWVPLQGRIDPEDQSNFLLCTARLKRDVSLQQARAEMTQVAQQFRREFPKVMADDEGISVIPATDLLGSFVKTAMLILMSAVGLVLLIACANVANLLLARATGRSRELAIRLAVGATRGAIARQLMTESVLLAVAGGGLGFLLGQAGTRALVAMLPVPLPMFDFNPDLRVLVFTMSISVLTGIVFGLAPVLQAWRADMNSALKESVRTGEARHTGLLRQTLVVGEVAITAVLVVAASLLLQSLFGLQRVAPGFDPHNVLTMQMSVTGPRYENPQVAADFYRRAGERLVAIPGIESAATVTSLPLERGPDFAFIVEDRGIEALGQWRAVTPSYFETLRIRLLRGRTFADTDTSNAGPVVIVNEALARKYWPGKDATGERITIGRNQNVGDPSRQIVGVVADVKESALDAASPEIVYVPAAQVPARVAGIINALLPVNWVIRTHNSPLAAAERVRAELRAIEPDLPVSNVRSMEQVMGQSLMIQGASAWLLSIFAGLAVVLAVTGVYGVMSYSVAIRTRELAVRAALGANSRDIAASVLRQAGKVAVVGLSLGLCGAVVLTQGMRGVLYGIAATNPLTYLATAVAITLVCLISSWLPARRAMQVDPNEALRGN